MALQPGRGAQALDRHGPAERVVVGPDIAAGHRVQLLIPGNTFHTARLLGSGDYFLGGSTEWPGVVPAEDVELGDPEALVQAHPEFAGEISEIVASVGASARPDQGPAAPPR